MPHPFVEQVDAEIERIRYMLNHISAGRIVAGQRRQDEFKRWVESLSAKHAALTKWIDLEREHFSWR